MNYYLKGLAARLELMKGKLAALNPQAVLNRGFSICYDSKGNIITDSGCLQPGDGILLRLRKGRAEAAVTHTYTEE